MSSAHIVCTTARQTSLFLALFLFSAKCIAQEVDNSVKTQSIFFATYLGFRESFKMLSRDRSPFGSPVLRGTLLSSPRLRKVPRRGWGHTG